MVFEVRLVAAALVVLHLTASAVAAQATPDSLARLVAVGDAAWERADHAAAFAAYDAVVRRDSAFSTRALFRVATLHGWSSRFDAAIAAHRAYVRLEPNDREGHVALARTLAWAARYAESLAIYDSLAASGDAVEARKGRAQVLAWRGDLGLAEDEWRAIVRDHPRDASAWVGLAQVLRWAGRPFAAEDALERALELAPNDLEATQQMRWVRVETKPQITMTLLRAEDSEGNTLWMHETRGAIATEANLRFSGIARQKWVGSTALNTVQVEAAVLTFAWQPGAGAWTYSGEVGGTQLPAISEPGPSEAIGGLRATGRLGPRWRLSAGVGREVFDEVSSALDAQVTYRGGDVDLRYAATQRLSLGFATSVGATQSRTNANNRTTALGAARYSFSRGFGAALTHRDVRWLDPEYGVFFAPQRLGLTELAVSWNRPGDLGWIAGADVGVGAQTVRFESDPVTSRIVPRAVLRSGWRPVPGREIVATFVYANVAGAGAISASEYRYGALTLAGRWTF